MKLLASAWLLVTLATCATAQECAYVAHSNDPGYVDLIDTETGRALVTYQTADSPLIIATGMGGARLLTSSYFGGSVSVIDTRSKLRTDFDEISRPLGVAVSTDGLTGYVANASSVDGALLEIDLVTATRRRTFPIGGTPVAVAILDDPPTAVVAMEDYPAAIVVIRLDQEAPDIRRIEYQGLIYFEDVARNFDGSGVLLIATAQATGRDVVVAISRDAWRRTATIPLNGIFPFAVAPSIDGAHAYVANYDTRDVELLDLVAGKSVLSIPLSVAPVDLTFSRDRSTLFLPGEDDDAVAVVDVATATEVRRIDRLPSASDIAIAPDGYCPAAEPTITPTSTATVTPTATPLPPPTILEIISGSFTRNVRARLDRNHDGRVNAADVIARAME